VPGAAGGVVGTGAGGAVIVKSTMFDVPPPGVGVNTLTGTEPASAMSTELIPARSWVALTNVVARLTPFQRTTDDPTKPLPFTVSVKLEPCAAALEGERLATTGTGLDVGAGRAGTLKPLHD